MSATVRVILVVMVVQWMKAKKSIWSITLVFLFISIFLTTTVQGASSQLRVLTLNVWDGWFAFGDYTDQRFEKICDRFKEAHADGEAGWDVIFLQEIWPVKKRKHAFENCGYPYSGQVDRDYDDITKFYMILAGIILGDKIDTGLKMISRYPLDNFKRHTYSVNGSGWVFHALRDGQYLASKSLMLADLHHPTMGKILLGNTHLISNLVNLDRTYHEERAIQLREMAGFFKKNWDHSYQAAVVGGDINMDPETGGPYDFPGYSWHDIIPEAFAPLYHATDGLGYSFHPAKNSLIKGDSSHNVMIDHLFASPSLSLQYSGIAMDESIQIEDEGNYLNIFYSDHFGVEAHFQL